MRERSQYHPNKILSFIVETSAGNASNYRVAVIGQLVFGFLYSFGYFELKIVGVIIGYILPILWVISSYRLLKFKAIKTDKLPFPGFIKKDPGNILVIIADIVFLLIIWFLILLEFYDPTWLRFIFTIIFPVLTLSMMRTLVIVPQDKEEQEKGGANSK